MGMTIIIVLPRQHFLRELLQACNQRGNEPAVTGAISDAELTALLARTPEETALFSAADVAKSPASRGSPTETRGAQQSRLASAEQVRELVATALKAAAPLDLEDTAQLGRGKRRHSMISYKEPGLHDLKRTARHT